MIPTYLKWLLVSVFLAIAANSEETPLTTAESVYKMEVAKARDKFVAFLKVEQVRLTKKGDLDAALVIREKIKELEDNAPAAESGTPKLPDGVYRFVNNKNPFHITVKKGVASLVEDNTGIPSISSTWVGNRIFFKWANGNDLMVLDLTTKVPSITCWSRMGDSKEIPTVAPWGKWSGKLEEEP